MLLYYGIQKSIFLILFQILYCQQEQNEELIRRTKELEKKLLEERQDIKQQRLDMAHKLHEMKEKEKEMRTQNTINHINRVDQKDDSAELDKY